MKKKYVFFLLLILLSVACGKSGEETDYSLLPVKTGNRFGYINLKGEYVINPQFDDVTMFHNGIARVKKDEKYGYIRKDGSYLCLPVYKNATIFSDGVAWTVMEKGEPVAIDTKGQELFTAKGARSVRNFSDGLAAFDVRSPDGNIYCGYMDKKGNVIISPSHWIAKPFNNGLAAVAGKSFTFGYINQKGKLVIAYQFNEARMFDENGRAIVKSDKDELFGVIDQKGNYIINPQFAEMKADGENYAISMDKHGDYGFCNEKGGIIINPQFSNVFGFHDSDLCPVTLNDDVGYIDRKGKLIINPQFKAATSFMGDIAAVISDNKIGLIDKKGNFVVNPQFVGMSRDIGIFGREGLDNEDGLTRLESQYLDIDKVVNNIKQLLDKGKLDGMAFPPSVGEVQKHYQIEGEEVPAYSAWEAKTWYWGEHLLAYLTLDGYFYTEASDGWWGTKAVLNERGQAETVSIRLNLFYITQGRASELEEGLQKAFKGGYENFKLGIECKDNDNIIITISK